MATIIATTAGNYDDCSLTGSGGSGDSFSGLRNETTGLYTDSVSFSNVGNGANSAGSFKAVYRAFFSFDLSGEDAGTIASATMKFYSSGDIPSGFFTREAQTDEFLHLCKAAPAGSDFVAADYNNLDGWVSSGTYNGNVTEYATKISQQGSGGWNTFTLNATAISEINSALGSGTIETALITSEDFTDNHVDPYSSGFFGTHGMYFSMSEAVNKPTLETTYAVPVSDSATFFGTNF